MTAPTIGVIGTGYGARVLADSLRTAGWDVAAIVSRSPARARDAAADHGISRWMTDVDELTADPRIDAVAVASPPPMHAAHVLAAIGAGKHVICEKPFGQTVEESERMVEAAVKAGVVHAVDYELRYVPARRAIKAAIAEGQLGDVLAVEVVEVSRNWNAPGVPDPTWITWRDAGGGILRQLGCHWIDSLLWWVGPLTEIVGVVACLRMDASARSHDQAPAEDTAALALRFTSGAVGTVFLSRAGTSDRLSLGVTGSTMSLALRGQTDLRFTPADGAEEHAEEQIVSAGAPGASPLQLAASVALADDVLQAVMTQRIEGSQPSYPTFLDGLRVQQALTTVLAASEFTGGVGLHPRKRTLMT